MEASTRPTFTAPALNGDEPGAFDPDLDDGQGAPGNDLDAIRSELADEIQLPEVTLPIPGRTGYSARFAPITDNNQFAAWRKKSADRSWPEGVNGVKLGCTVLAAQCVAILRHDREIRDSAGKLWTFRHPEFWQAVGAGRAVEAVKRFYANDFSIDKAAQDVIEASQLEGDDADPMPAS